MQSHSENTKRIAKNTLMLYGRMLFSMVVSLYTSRVVLNVLGAEDFGIANVVGGVIAMLGFLNDSMSGATSRFLTYELGRGDHIRLRNTFSAAVMIHICIAFVILIFGETVGLWFLNNKLVIPENRMFAAHVVYHLTIISTMLGILQTPYNAAIISHERMDVFAYVSLLNVFLRLLIVYLLVIGDFDKLILYSILQFIVSIIIIMIYRIYCRRNFQETVFSLNISKEYLTPMLSFSGWDLFGNMSVIARTQGVSMLLNMFYGPLANAAAGVATQVQGAVMSLAGNLVTAARPQIVKSYALGEYRAMFKLMLNSIKLSFVLLSICTIPLLVETDFVLTLWLKSVPDNTIPFCRLTLLFNLFANTSLLLAAVIHSTGKIKRISLINGSLYVSVIPITYILFKWVDIIWIPYLFNTGAVFLGMLSNAWTLHLYIPEFSFRKFVLKDLFSCISVFVFVLIISLIITHFIEAGWLRLIINIIVSSILLVIVGFYFLISSSDRMAIINLIRNKLCPKV